MRRWLVLAVVASFFCGCKSMSHPIAKTVKADQDIRRTSRTERPPPSGRRREPERGLSGAAAMTPISARPEGGWCASRYLGDRKRHDDTFNTVRAPALPSWRQGVRDAVNRGRRIELMLTLPTRSRRWYRCWKFVRQRASSRHESGGKGHEPDVPQPGSDGSRGGLRDIGPRGSPDAASESFFELKVRPVLAGTCVKCHGAKKASGGLRLDSREAMLAGGESGPAVVPGRPEGSLLIQAVRHADESLKMPPEQAAAREPPGTTWPRGSPPARPGRRPPRRRPIEGQAHWAFEPLRTITPPEDPTGWAAQPIDRFIAAGHRANGLHPVARADRRTLIRRAYFDLIGLPPSPSGSRRSSPTSGPTPSRGWSTSCSPRPATASAGDATGSTSPATPTRPATTPTIRSPRRTSTATT